MIIAIGSFAACQTEIGWNVLGFKQYLISLCILLLCLQVSGIPIKIYLSLLMNLVSNHSRTSWNLLNIPETGWRYCVGMPFNLPNMFEEIENIKGHHASVPADRIWSWKIERIIKSSKRISLVTHISFVCKYLFRLNFRYFKTYLRCQLQLGHCSTLKYLMHPSILLC